MTTVEKALESVLEGYASFLRERMLAPLKHQPHLVRWVQEFLLFAKQHRGYTFEQMLELFLAALGEIDSVQQNLKLAPSKEGPIQVCTAFTPEIGEVSKKHGFVLADPVLVYAELLATDDPRCGETALLIKEKHLPWIP